MINYLRKNILGLCMFASVLFWFTDAILDSYYKDPRHSLLQAFLTDEPAYEFYWRIILSILLISIGIVARSHFDVSAAFRNIQWKSGFVRRFSPATVPAKAASKHHVIISGTGRAGTTFLVQLFTALKLDTGFDDPFSGIYPISNAGMEFDIRQPNAPYIVKNPELSQTLDDFLLDTNAIIDYAIIPIRDLYSAAESRRDVSRRAGGPAPGGIWQAKTPEDMESFLTLEFYNLFFVLAKHGIPVTLLQFPRTVNDPEYLYNQLHFLFPNVSYAKFLACYQSVTRPDLVHVFNSDT